MIEPIGDGMVRVSPDHFYPGFRLDNEPSYTDFFAAVGFDPKVDDLLGEKYQRADELGLAASDRWLGAKYYVDMHEKVGQFGDAYEMPEEAAGWVLDYLDGDTRGNLVFSGPVGVGKSHSAAATACFFAATSSDRRRQGQPVRGRGSGLLFSSTSKILQTLKNYRRVDDQEEMQRKVDQVGVIVLDDLGRGREDPTNADIELLTRILEERRDSHRATIITTNLEESQIEDRFGSHFASRLYHGEISVRMSGADRRAIA